MFYYKKKNKVLLSFCVYSWVCLCSCMGVHSTIVCMCMCVQIDGHFWVLFLNDHFILGDSWGLAKWAGMASQWAQRVPVSDTPVLELHIHAIISKHHYKCFSRGFLELNSDPHVYMTSALLTELCANPSFIFKKREDEGMIHTNTFTSLFPWIYDLHRLSQRWLIFNYFFK